jgi:hypothetical protein
MAVPVLAGGAHRVISSSASHAPRSLPATQTGVLAWSLACTVVVRTRSPDHNGSDLAVLDELTGRLARQAD